MTFLCTRGVGLDQNSFVRLHISGADSSIHAMRSKGAVYMSPVNQTSLHGSQKGFFGRKIKGDLN